MKFSEWTMYMPFSWMLQKRSTGWTNLYFSLWRGSKSLTPVWGGFVVICPAAPSEHVYRHIYPQGLQCHQEFLRAQFWVLSFSCSTSAIFQLQQLPQLWLSCWRHLSLLHWLQWHSTIQCSMLWSAAEHSFAMLLGNRTTKTMINAAKSVELCLGH